MASVQPITTILQLADICQYLAAADQGQQQQLRGGYLGPSLMQQIFITKQIIRNIYTLNPNDPQLFNTGNYLFRLLGKYAIQAQAILAAIAGGLPALTGPADQSVVVGATATFSVTVTGTGPFTYQWYQNNTVLPGATGSSYLVTNAQLAQSGNTYFVKVSNAAGTVTSRIATLTVTTTLTAKWWYGPTDPFPALSGGSDTLAYQITESITHNAAIVITYPVAAENNQFNVLRYPNTENDKTTWFNDNTNQGIIGDPTMRPILNINGFKYIISRTAMSLDNLATTLTYT